MKHLNCKVIPGAFKNKGTTHVRSGVVKVKNKVIRIITTFGTKYLIDFLSPSHFIWNIFHHCPAVNISTKKLVHSFHGFTVNKISIPFSSYFNSITDWSWNHLFNYHTVKTGWTCAWKKQVGLLNWSYYDVSHTEFFNLVLAGGYLLLISLHSKISLYAEN